MQKPVMITANTAGTQLPPSPGGSTGLSARTLRYAQRLMSMKLGTLAALEVYTRASEATGGKVIVSPEYGCLPALIGRDDQPVFLYAFVEALDGAVDYQQLQAEFPSLSFAQIAGAIAFLRKLAQFNAHGVDIDQLEDEHLEGDPEFQALVTAALADPEVRRVPVGE